MCVPARVVSTTLAFFHRSTPIAALDPIPVAVDPEELAVLPLMPIAPDPSFMRVTHDPVTGLPCITIIAPAPFSVYPNVFGRGLGRPVVCRFGRHRNNKNIIRDPFPVAHDPVPFLIWPLRPMPVDKDLIRLGYRPVSGLIHIMVVHPDPFTVYPEMLIGRPWRTQIFRLGHPHGYTHMRYGLPIPRLPIGAAIRVPDPLAFHPNMVFFRHCPEPWLADIGIALRDPFPFYPDMVGSRLGRSFDKRFWRQDVDGDANLRLDRVDAGR